MKKQIDEIAKLICTYPQCIHYNIIGECANTECQTVYIAENLYKQGYRKQSEGEWEKRTFIIFDIEKVGYKCSECNTTWDTETKYCPNCGAHMKGGE